MRLRSTILLAAIVLAQAATEEFKGEAEIRRRIPAPGAPRDGYWAAPPGESGASRHAPRPGPGELPPAESEDEVPRLELEPGGDASK
jgi:hypothetical protein